MPNINIEIKGTIASGKTTVAKIIANALNAAGIPCEVDDGEDGDYGKWLYEKTENLKKKNTLVKIKTVALNKEAKPH